MFGIETGNWNYWMESRRGTERNNSESNNLHLARWVRTPWVMQPGSSVLHMKGLSNNPYSELNQPRSILILSSHPALISTYVNLNFTWDFPLELFFVGLLFQILKTLLPYSFLAICPAHLNILEIITLTILGEYTNYEVPHCEASSILILFGPKYTLQDVVFKYP
jgi:hypothetical protein